ncbi:MAG: amidohydrolase, partial [Glaciihabitans sp.]|nr:amidohydrolase [Glaciihabitans sp.]
MLLRNTILDGRRVDVEITDGVISAIGDLSGVGTDADGRWLVPGLWDNHVHFSQWSMGSRRLDLGDATSAAEAATRVSVAMAAETERARGGDLSAETYVAVGFRDGLWPDAPTIDLLDAVSAVRPIVLVSADLHAVWLNSSALHLFGHDGHPTGLLREDPAFDVTRRVNTIDPAVLDGWAAECATTAAARGVVGIVDLEMDWNLDNWLRRISNGAHSLRVEFGIYSEHLERAIALGLRTGQRINDLLAVGGFKVLTDGSLNTRTAFCYDEYPGHTDEGHTHGMLTVPPDELVQRMRRAV